MDNSSSTNKSLVVFFTLTLALSTPFYILNALAYLNIIGGPEMGALYIVLFTAAPIASALILTCKKDGNGDLKKLLVRVIDFRKIRENKWYVAIIFLPPFFYILSLGWLTLSGASVPAAMAPLMASPIVLLFFFLLATGEEVGWMGYAFESMQAQYGALRAALLLGIIWALWHVPFLIFMIPDTVAITAQLLTLVAGRVLIAWIFNNTGKSVFAAILFHALDNTALVIFPEIKAVVPWGSIMFCGLVVVAAFIVTLLWGANTLAQYKFNEGIIR